jgi:quercetin dioxygenase-like cupin family protein
MRTLGSCRLFDLDDEPALREGSRTYRKPISRQNGAKYIAQTVSDYAPGRSAVRVNPSAEEVLYVVAGSGECLIDGNAYPLSAGVGVHIPAGCAHSIENHGPGAMQIVGVTCPEDDGTHIVTGYQPTGASNAVAPRRTVSEHERPAIPTGDRQFKLMVDKDLGCEQITQFVGFIPPSKGPMHFHPYEEAIYILEGSGVVHIDEESGPFHAGTSIFLPIGCNHCLENPGPAPVRLLGVFYPAGSPAVRYPADSERPRSRD